MYRCIYSKNKVGSKNRPTKNHEKLLQWIDNVYCWGKKVIACNLVGQTQLRYNDTMEKHHCTRDRTRGGSIETQGICSICYSKKELVPTLEVGRQTIQK